MLLVEFMLYYIKCLKKNQENVNMSLKKNKNNFASISLFSRALFEFIIYGNFSISIILFFLKSKISKCTRGFCQISFDLSGMQHKSSFITNNSSLKCQNIYAIYKTDVLHFFLIKKTLYNKRSVSFATVLLVNCIVCLCVK